jgi:hypothetical protein
MFLFLFFIFFAMSHLIGLSPKNYEISSSRKNIYIILHLHCFTQPYKII